MMSPRQFALVALSARKRDIIVTLADVWPQKRGWSA